MNKNGHGFDKLIKICEEYNLGQNIKDIKPFGSGHINNTFLVEYHNSQKRYVLQQINHNIFKKPFEVMQNTILVTEHLRKKYEGFESDLDRKCLQVLLTKDEKLCYADEEGNYWRIRPNVENVFALDRVDNAEQMYYAGKAFGKFLNDLSDFDAAQLNETIIDFHNTPKRFASLVKTVEEDRYNRCMEAKKEIEYLFDRERECSKLLDMYNSGELPLRVTHNDTKINNVLFDNDSREGICIIDLDTLMPGLTAYDFGDSIRSGANTADEDERDLDKVHFDIERFRCYAKGYLEENENLTENERKTLAFSAKLLCLEQAIRFLDDHLKNDVYFKISRPNQNLDRARTQIKMIYEIEKNMDEMNKIVEHVSKSFSS